eukprot:4851756-Amphidinium_carterae.1
MIESTDAMVCRDIVGWDQMIFPLLIVPCAAQTFFTALAINLTLSSVHYQMECDLKLADESAGSYSDEQCA